MDNGYSYTLTGNVRATSARPAPTSGPRRSAAFGLLTAACIATGEPAVAFVQGVNN